jgi:hypothetical protein
VKLAVTPIGSSTPQEVPLTFLPGSDPTQIAVQPASALPLGTVSFTWGGVVDAATNPVTGTVTATFAVDRSQILDFVASPAVVQMPMAIDGSGRVVVAWRDDSNQINVARRDGEAWTPFGAPADNPAGSAFTFAQPIRWTVGVDADERPWIVLTRADTADTDRYHVRRFDGTSWQDVGDPFPGRRFGDSGVNPAILFDAQGRPVIAFLRSSSLDVFRFDATSAAWTSLGSASAGLTNLPGPFRFARLDDGSLVAAILGGFGGSNAASLFVSRNPSPESGTTWSLVGPAIDSVPNATQFIRNEIGLAGGPGGPWVTYVKGADRQILAAPLVRFDGNAWVPTAIPPPATNLPVVFIDVAIQDGVPLVVYQASDSNVRVRRLVDGAFEDAFDATPPGRRVEELSVVARGSAAFVAATSQSSEHGFTVERLLFP